MSWKDVAGAIAGKSVLAWAKFSSDPQRPLTPGERAQLEPIFETSLDFEPVRIREPATGLVAISQRAFVIENTLFVPRAFMPLKASVLVHEMVHVWQHQHGGHAYIADSLQAQFFGDGYDLSKGLREGREWSALNCEQQATLIERAFESGCFFGKPLFLHGHDFTREFEAAITELRAGRGATFSG